MNLVAVALGLLIPVFAVLSAGHALLHKREPRSALGWVACCLFLPYVGPFIYLIFGINRARSSARKMRPEFDDGGAVLPSPDSPDLQRFPLAAIGARVTQKELLPCSGFKVLVNGDEAYPDMLQAIRDAREKIFLATYIFGHGDITAQFIEELKQAVERGVDVKIILDGMGESMSFPPVGKALRKAGIPFRRFNPFTLIPPSLHINLRNHRKVLVVDGRIGFTGGMNIDDDNIHATPGRRKIQDIHFRVEGHIVCDLEYSFLKDWNYCGGKNEPPPYICPQPMRVSPGDDLPWARLVLAGPNEDLDKLSDILCGVMTAAQSRIWVMTPYFLPDAEMIGMFQAARLRGVDVKVILPSGNNIPPTDWACRHLCWQLLKYGVEIYYQERPFSHGKLFLVDDAYSLIGTANLDPRSLRLNYELNLEIFSHAVNSTLEGYFQARLQSAERYREEDRARRSLPVELRDAAAWLFSPYL